MPRKNNTEKHLLSIVASYLRMYETNKDLTMSLLGPRQLDLRPYDNLVAFINMFGLRICYLSKLLEQGDALKTWLDVKTFGEVKFAHSLLFNLKSQLILGDTNRCIPTHGVKIAFNRVDELIHKIYYRLK